MAKVKSYMLESYYTEITETIHALVREDDSSNQQEGKCFVSEGDALKNWRGRPYERCCEDMLFDSDVIFRVSSPDRTTQTVWADESGDSLVKLQKPVLLPPSRQIDFGPYCTNRGMQGHPLLFIASFSALGQRIRGRVLATDETDDGNPQAKVFLPDREINPMDEVAIAMLLRQERTPISYQEYLQHLFGSRQQFEQLGRV